MKKLHIYWGWLFAGSFAASGFWMQSAFPEAWHGDRGMRMFYRSAHVYILLGALINSVLGAYLRPATTAMRQRIQLAGSAQILMSPVLFTLAFWIEASPGGMSRPLSAAGLAVAIFGALCHLYATREQDPRAPAELEHAGAHEPPGPAHETDATPVTTRPSRPEPSRAADAEPTVRIEQRIAEDWSAVRAGLARVRGRIRAWGWRRCLAGIALGAAVVGLASALRRPDEPPHVVSDAEVEKVLARTTIAVQPDEQVAVRKAARAGLRFAPVQFDAVIDLETNLMWAPRDNRNAASWDEALLYAESFDARGYTDWRLPTIEELLALSEGMRAGGGPEPAPGSPSVDPTLPVGYGVPWSSERRGTEAARVHLSSGSVGWIPQTSTSHNRSLPVRDNGASRPPAAEVRVERELVSEASERLFSARNAAPLPLRSPP